MTTLDSQLSTLRLLGTYTVKGYGIPFILPDVPITVPVVITRKVGIRTQVKNLRKKRYNRLSGKSKRILYWMESLSPGGIPCSTLKNFWRLSKE